MKNLFFLIILILPTKNLVGQNVVKFIDFETKLPLSEMYGYVYRDGNIFEDCGASCENGCRKLRVNKIDSTAKYLFVFNYYKYFPIWKEINPRLNDTLLIEVRKDPYYFIPAENILYNVGCNHISLSGYEPKVPRAISDLPKEIAEKVSQHIKSRVGDIFFEKMRLIDGQIFELDILKRRFPEWKDNEISAYYLCFSYRNLEWGIGMLISSIEFDEKGNVLKEISLPNIVSNPEKGIIISFDLAKKIALEKGFNLQSNTAININYRKKEDILTWVFKNQIHKDNHTSETQIMIINAHNGNFIETKTQKGTWID